MNARTSLISLLVRASLLAGSMVAQASPVIGLPPLRSDSVGSGVEKESMRQGYEALRAAQHDKAEKAFREANRLNPLAPEPMLGLAVAAQGMGKTELALQAYQSAAMLSPTDPLPSALRGQYLEQLKRPAEAELAYRDALRVSKDHPGVMNNLAFLLATQKVRLEEALGLAQAAVRASPTRGNYLDTLGMVQLARGDTAAAQQSFEKALALEPGNAAIKRHLEQLPVAKATAPVAALAAAPSAPTKVAPAVAPVVLAASAAPSPKLAKPEPAPASIDPVKAIGPALEAWRQAWEAKDISRYLAFYAKGFVPADQKSRSAWEADRRVKLAKKGDIQVTIAQAAFATAGDAVVVNFEQKYQSSNYRDSTRKQIEWVREGDVWRIQREVQR
jgi:Flp pilus assembly protein TadD/ketosteroid isomerase-like protein